MLSTSRAKKVKSGKTTAINLATEEPHKPVPDPASMLPQNTG
jgi:hypothetical protein